MTVHTRLSTDTDARSRGRELGSTCAQQIAALSGGREHVLMAPDAAQAETKEQGRGIGFISALAWPGALRLLDRKSPGYDI